VGANARASGWITGLSAQADGIWADVEWTAAAAAAITAREYRYISPYFGFEKTSGRVTRIFSAGLVNYPNFTELAAVASAGDPEGTPMLKAIAQALGLPETATEADCAAAAKALKASAEAAATAAANPDPAKFVPMAAFEELRAQVGELATAGVEEKATAAVDAAIREGRVTPAGREHALSLNRSNPESFAAFVASAPKVLAPGAGPTRISGVIDPAAPLTKEEKATAAALGLTDEAYLASKKSFAGA
jgi:phage I-like protein